MKDGLPWRERMRRRGTPVAEGHTPDKHKVRCYLVRLTGVYEPADRHGISRPYYLIDETQETKLWDDLDPGAMAVGQSGPYVKLPDGRTWYIDSRASNCDKPGDSSHRCWVRHGEPPNLTVDKIGNTCGAGGGSIATDGYHGFLRGGFLERC